MGTTVTIDRRFSGPPASGNGGYVCGVVAGFIGDEAEVALRRPPPLGRPLEVELMEAGRVVLRDGDTVIAEGSTTSVEIEVPQPVTLEDADNAVVSQRRLRRHPYPTCFVCGPKRAEGDGLRIFPGRVRGRNVVAASWTPDRSLAAEDGSLRPEFAWAALDCPSGWARSPAPGLPTFLEDLWRLLPWGSRAGVLARLAARLIAPVSAGERCVVMGWPLGEDGRRRYSGSALFSADGELRAVARSTWVRLTRPLGQGR